MTPSILNSSAADSLESGAGNTLELQITETGHDLLNGLLGVLDAIPESAEGPQSLARAVGVDKVLASRVLKATRGPDAMSALFRMPGPDPLRRLIRGSAKRGVGATAIKAASKAIDRFEHLIRIQVGDRSTLDTIVSAWVPEARREFELRRKQAAFKAMSQLKGAQAKTIVSSVFLGPSADGERLDIVWLTGFIGLYRLRPGASVKFATRRVGKKETDRKPRTLRGNVVEDIAGVQLEEFSSSPLPQLSVERVGEVTHYTLGGDAFGPRSAVDLIAGEVNMGEMRRTIPRGSNRKSYVFAEVSLPAMVLQFDTFVHKDIYPKRDPSLRLYDTMLEGVADINDPSRDIDRFDLLESLDALGSGATMCRSADVPRCHEMVGTVFDRMSWNPREFRGYRCRVEYPVYGMQVAMVFDPPESDNAIQESAS